MSVQDPGKLLLLGIAMIGGFVMWGLGNGEGVAIVFSVLGYLTGNGVLARKGKTPVPTIGRRESSDDEQQ